MSRFFTDVRETLLPRPNGRRTVSVTAMIAGVVIGAVFVLHVAIALPLVTALVVLVAVAVPAHGRGSTDAPLVHP